MTMLIESNSVHLWQASLANLATLESACLELLNKDELIRANRFRFPIHRQRFILARGILRQILGHYLNLNPKEILFSYGPHGKPYMEKDAWLQFNVSHSEDRAVYALTTGGEIGVDIQKIDERYHEDVAKRFFNENEFSELNKLPESKRPAAFAKLWASKEAIIKLLGSGFYISIADFQVNIHKRKQTISLINKINVPYYLENFKVHTQFRAAFATTHRVTQIEYWSWMASGPSRGFI